MQKTIECFLIDDDNDDQEIFEMCLKKVVQNVNIRFAENGIVAINLLAATEFVPDYIFIDVNMPKMNGLDCLKELKKNKKLTNTRFFMYSTTAEGNSVEESELLGAQFLIKPAKPSELKEKLAQIFEGSSTK